MTRTRREFSPEFKREVVALLESGGRPQMQIAAELGIQPSWLVKLASDPERAAIASAGEAGRHDRAGGGFSGRLGVGECQAPARARAHVRMRMERDVLKGAIGIFAEVPR
jgi:transposase